MAQVKFTTGKLGEKAKRGEEPRRVIAQPNNELVVSIAARSFKQAFKAIDDVLRKEAGCTTELDYTEQSSWLLFLKYLDGLEADKATEAALERKKYAYIIDRPYRSESWAAPKDKASQLDHNVT